MRNAELFGRFETEVKEFARFRGYVDKANALASKYSEDVLKRVVDDHTGRALAVAERLIPMVMDVDATIEALDNDREGLTESRAGSQLQLEELELRLTIEEISQEDYDKESDELKGELSAIDSQVGEIQDELGKFREVLGRWNTLGVAAGVLVEEE